MREQQPWLMWNRTTADHLWTHGLTIDDAIEVANDQPILLHQPGKDVGLPDGEVRRRPDRRRMIGLTRAQRLLVLVIEYPDEYGRSQIVTGRHAGKRESAEYHQRRRRI